jgi:hypothetical protein
MLEVSGQWKKILISIDPDMICNDYFLKFIERMRLEDIAKESQLSEEDEMEIAEVMKDDWWQKNKNQLLDEINE